MAFDINELTPEQLEKARACKTPEDVIALAKEEGYELSDEEPLLARHDPSSLHRAPPRREEEALR